jgi:adenine-specific DNA-methyltransferase
LETGRQGERLRRGLKTAVDEAARSSMCSTVRRPFGEPETGKIAVKVINHYGDEALKVYRVEGGKTDWSLTA